VLHLSVDGPTAEIHNRQRPGAASSYDNFQDVVSGLRAVREARGKNAFPLLAPISCITQGSVDHLVELHQLCHGLADLHILYLIWWIDELAAAQHTREFARRFGQEPSTHLGWVGGWKDVDPEQLAAQLARLRAFPDAYRSPALILPDLREADELRAYYTRHEETFGYDQCVSIFMSAEIDSNGNVSLCRDYHDHVIGNIQRESLVSMWQGEKARAFRSSLATWGLMPACRRCCGLMGY